MRLELFSNEVPIVKTGIIIGSNLPSIKAMPSKFITAFNNRWHGPCDYQEVLHWLAEINEPEWALKLIQILGGNHTKTVISKNTHVNNVFVAGDLIVSGYLQVRNSIIAGRSIEAEDEIVAEGDIISNNKITFYNYALANRDIIAKKSIRADFNLKAGGSIRTDGSLIANQNVIANKHIISQGNISVSRELRAGGNIISEYSIEAKQNIEAGGDIKVKSRLISGRSILAEKNIIAGEEIETGGSLIAGEAIKSEACIKAGCGIKAKEIHCALRIFAGLIAYRNPQPEEMKIYAKIERGKVAYGILIPPIEEPYDN